MNHIANLFPSYKNTPSSDENQKVLEDSDELLLENHPTSSEKQTLVDSAVLLSMIDSMQEQLNDMRKLVSGKIVHTPAHATTSSTPRAKKNLGGSEEVYYGTFTGESMQAENGQNYPVSPNYASKSKLIEGDSLKLTIEPSGRFVYKQVEMTPRTQTTGKLAFDAVKNQWVVFSNGKNYNILTASVTFHKGEVGDEAHIIIPANGGNWAAIEYIQK